MEDIKILLEEKTNLIIGEKVYRIGTLGYTQLYKLTEWLNSIIGKLAKPVNEKTNRQDILAIIKQLPPEDVETLFSIILDDSDKEAIRSLILSNLNVTIKVIDAVFELNQELKENFSKSAEKIFPKKKAETPPTSSSK
jgi:hypothetical protein